MTRTLTVLAIVGTASAVFVQLVVKPCVLVALDELDAEAQLDALAFNLEEHAAMRRDVAEYWDSVQWARDLTRADVVRFIAVRAAAGEYHPPRYMAEPDPFGPSWPVSQPDPMEGPCDTPSATAPPTPATAPTTPRPSRG